MSLDNIQLDIVVTLQGSQAFKNTERALAGINRGMRNVRQSAEAQVPINLRQIRTWDQLTSALGAVERKYDAVFRAGAHMSMMGQGLLDTSERLARGAIGIVDAYEGYDMMLRRGAVALNTNTEWQGKLDEAIQTTARTIGLLSPEEVAEGYYIWGAAAGVVVDTQKELNEITAVVQDTMIATAMAGGTLEGNLNGVYGVLAQFNLPASQATDIVHKLALMTERTAAQFPDLINSLSYIGPLAESLGVSFEDVTSILGLLADAGQKGSRAGRGLSMVIEGMSAPSGPAKESLDGLVQSTHGLSAAWEDVIFPEGQFVGMRDLVFELADGLEDYTDAERGRFYATAFTNNATRALIPVIEDQIRANEAAAASGKEVTSVLDDQKYALDGAGHFFETMKDQALGSITAIKGRLESSFFPVLQTMAKTIMEMAMPAIEWLGKMGEEMGDWLAENPELVKFAVKIAGIATAAMAAAGVLFAFGGAIMYLIGNLGVFVQGIGRVLGPFAILGVAIGLVVDAVIRNVGGIQDSLKNFGGALGEFWSVLSSDGAVIRDFWKSVWETLKSVIDTAVTAIAEGLDILAGWLRELSKNEGAMDFLRGALDVFVQFRGALAAFALLAGGLWAANSALSFLMGMLKILSGYTMLKGILMGIATGFSVLKAALTTGGLVSAIQTLIGLIIGAQIALSPIIGVVLLIAGAIALLALAWANNWGGIRDIVGNVVNWFNEVLFPTISGIVTAVSEAAVGVYEWFTNMVETISTAVGQIIEFIASIPGAVADFVSAVVTKVTEFIASVPGMLVDAVVWIKDQFVYWWGFMLGFIIGMFIKIVAEAVKFAVNFVAGIVDWIVKLPGRIADFFSTIWNNLTTWFGQVIPQVGTWAGDVVTGIVDWFAKLPGRIGTWLSTLWTDLTTFFSDLVANAGPWAMGVINKIVEWFKKLPGNVVRGIGSLVTKLGDFFEGLPGRILQKVLEVGRAIVEGVWSGISGMIGWFTQQVTNFFSGIVDGVKAALGIQSPSKVFAEIGQYMVKGMAVGIAGDNSAMNALNAYTNSLVGVAAGTSIGFSALETSIGEGSITSDSRRTVRIEMDLTSSDGSMDNATLEQLKTALTGTDLVRALERMAEAD